VTVMTVSVLIPVAIDTEKELDVAVIDLFSAYLHSKMDDLVIMILFGELADLMAAVVPIVERKYITYGKDGTAILYVMLQRLCRTLKSALLCYQKLVSN